MRNCFLLLLACAASSLLPAQPITACNTTIGVAGNYYLTGNLTCGATAGITVLADNVNIDLRGFVLSGSGVNHGVTNSVSNSCATVPKYVSVYNGRISNFGVGINVCANAGISPQLARWSLHDLTLSLNSSGVYLFNVVGVTVFRNVIERNTREPQGLGVGGQYGVLTSVTDNTIRNNKYKGISFSFGREELISGNTVQSNGGYGIQLSAAQQDTIRTNQSYSHTVFDMADQNPLGVNTWTGNLFGTKNAPWIN